MKHVLVARMDSMGDMLICGPAIRAVSRSARVSVLCGPRGEAAAKLLPGVDEVLTWNCPWIANPAPKASSEHVSALLSMLRERAFDEAIIFTSFHQSPLPLALLMRMSDIPRITGASVDYPGSLLDVRVVPGHDVEELIPEPLRAIAIAEAAGYPADDDTHLAVRVTAEPKGLNLPSPYTVLHPGADAPARQWPIEGYVRVAERLIDQGYHVIVTGHTDERELTEKISHEVPDVIDLTGTLNLEEFAQVLYGAEVLVAGNTGPAHLAAATGTPVVSLFAPVTPASNWAPYGVPVMLLGDQEAPCKNTRARNCPIPGHPCLSGVDPEAVVAAVHQFLEQPAALERKR